MKPDEIKKRLEIGLPGSQVEVSDLTGTGDHFEVTIVSSAFEGKSPIDRHRMVYGALGQDVGGAIHALSIKATTPQDSMTPDRPRTN